MNARNRPSAHLRPLIVKRQSLCHLCRAAWHYQVCPEALHVVVCTYEVVLGLIDVFAHCKKEGVRWVWRNRLCICSSTDSLSEGPRIVLPAWKPQIYRIETVHKRLRPCRYGHMLMITEVCQGQPAAAVSPKVIDKCRSVAA